MSKIQWHVDKSNGRIDGWMDGWCPWKTVLLISIQSFLSYRALYVIHPSSCESRMESQWASCLEATDILSQCDAFVGTFVRWFACLKLVSASETRIRELGRPDDPTFYKIVVSRPFHVTQDKCPGGNQSQLRPNRTPSYNCTRLSHNFPV